MTYSEQMDDQVHARQRKEKLDYYKSKLLIDGVDIETVEAFIKYHEENPQIWHWFKHFAFKAIKKGKKYGAKGILERVRWDIEIETDGEFKINNNFPAYYARIFSIRFPQHKDFFETRKVSGIKEAA